MKNIDSKLHVTGASLFVDDLITRNDTLFGVVFDSPKAHGVIKQIDYSKAEKLEGVVRIFTHRDIMGDNEIGGIVEDEPLWAEKHVHFHGQPIAFIVAKTESIAKKARALIDIKIDELPIVTTAKEAKAKNLLTVPPSTFTLGDTTKAFAQCEFVLEGEAFTNGQEHLYLETQGCYAVPQENGCIKITSSTQGPTALQRTAARVLGVPMHKIEVDVIRLGGGFGGKEDQATPWSVMAAVAVQHLNRPIKFIVNRHDDLRMTGKRHPYTSTFKIGLNKDKKIIAYEAEYLQNAGAAADLSPAVAERTLFHATNSYYVPNVTATIFSCKTNLPPNTAFRGFGGPQGMFVIESAIRLAAKKIGCDPSDIQEANLLKEKDEFPYGQIATNVEAKNSWESAKEKFDLNQLKKEIKDFNNNNQLVKKGLALMPITFGISFTNIPLNHARALVHIYQDGSVGISTAAVEMGQGVNTKMLQVAQQSFGISSSKVKLETTNTTRVANTSASAASATADLNGKAVAMACDALIIRLKSVAAKMKQCSEEDISFKEDLVFINNTKSDTTWKQVIAQAMMERVALTENAHYATPDIHFDKQLNKGNPFAYHVYGTSITGVTVDCLRGTYEIDYVKIVHDFGKSMNMDIDLGQIEGGLIQGIGWMTMEEISFDSNGRLASNALSTYKVPDIFSVPKVVETIPVETPGNDQAILKSKAVGEPPLMYGIGTYFALQQSIMSFNKSYALSFNAPMTPEKLLLSLYQKK